MERRTLPPGAEIRALDFAGRVEPRLSVGFGGFKRLPGPSRRGLHTGVGKNVLGSTRDEVIRLPKSTQTGRSQTRASEIVSQSVHPSTRRVIHDLDIRES